MEEKEAFEGFCVLELMGHRRLGGYVREQEIAGSAFIRIDVPGPDGVVATQFYAPGAVYCITPTTEPMARAVALRNQPEPVTRWELPQLEEPKRPLYEGVSFDTPTRYANEEDEDDDRRDLPF
jgi:hypothetical protein